MGIIHKKKPSGAPRRNGSSDILQDNLYADSSGIVRTLSLQNFQSHHDTKIGFHRGVNVIVGSSDSGKSAILRALKWICFNRPNGDGFCTFGKKQCEATAEINEHSISRAKGKDNYYALDGDKIVAFGQGLPSEIENACGVTAINVQEQMDSPYLLSQSSGEVARILNKAVDLDCIDVVTSQVRSELTAIRQQIVSLQTQYDSKKNKLAAFDILPNVQQILLEAQSIQEQMQAKRILQNKIKNIIASLQELPDWSVAEKAIERCETAALVAEKKQAAYKESAQSRNALHALLSNIKVIRQEQREQEAFLEQLNEQLNAIMPDSCPICGGAIHK